MPFMVPTVLTTPRLLLEPVTLPLVEAVLAGQRQEAERLLRALLPDEWPGRALVERAFRASIDDVRKAPEHRLWGDRVMVLREGERRVVGSVIFRGAPDVDGAVHVAYGVERQSQGQGYASEGTVACIEWALGQQAVRVVRATTPPWHLASRKVLERAGLSVVGVRDHELMGELLEYERRSGPLADATLH